MNYITFKLIYTAFKLFLFMSYFNMGYIRVNQNQSVFFFQRSANFLNCFKWKQLFHAEHLGVYFSAPRVEECSTMGKT